MQQVNGLKKAKVIGVVVFAILFTRYQQWAVSFAFAKSAAQMLTPLLLLKHLCSAAGSAASRRSSLQRPPRPSRPHQAAWICAIILMPRLRRRSQQQPQQQS